MDEDDGYLLDELQDAAAHGDLELVQWILQTSIVTPHDPEDSFGWTALQQAARYGHSEVLEYMLQVSKRIYMDRKETKKNDRCSENIVIPQEMTALCLHWACMFGHYDCVKTLLRYGAIPNRDHGFRSSYTPLHLAAFHHREKCVALLLENGADPNIRDSDGNTVLAGTLMKKDLCILRKDEFFRVIRLLIRNGGIGWSDSEISRPYTLDISEYLYDVWKYTPEELQCYFGCLKSYQRRMIQTMLLIINRYIDRGLQEEIRIRILQLSLEAQRGALESTKRQAKLQRSQRRDLKKL